jgi:lysophospholipase L1-like esterase
MEPIRGLHWRGRPIGRAILARLLVFVLVAGGLVVAGPQADTASAADVDCARRLLAGGDRVPAGQEVSTDERYPSQLVEDHLGQYGPWCVYNTAANGATSSGYITRGQLAESWNKAADLITVTVGAENDGIKKLFTDCFDKVKDHDFTGANVCAAQVLANEQAFTNLKLNLTTILQQYRVLAARRPNLVVAVTGYPNPYPDATEAAIKVVQLCVPLIDTIPTCSIRWAQLPPALATIDAAVKKLNSAIKAGVANFQLAANGQRFVYVDTYETLRDHCMKMEVTIKTKVEHPEQSGAVHLHDSGPVNFGCSDPWFVEGSDGTKIPDYLEPATLGILIEKSQTTKGMGIHPDVDGHDCISDLVFEADTIEPGTTPLKWKLNIAQPPETACS